MRQGFFKREHTTTPFVLLDTKKCEACWECISVCSKNVIGRINLPWHKHVKFINSSECIGCLKCVKVCSATAIVKHPKSISDEK